MNRHILAAAAGALAILVPAAAMAAIEARPIEEKRLVSGKDAIDPTKGYIYLHGDRAGLMLIKEPSEAELAAFEAEWRRELAEAREKYERQMKRWDETVKMARERRMRAPVPPVEPTEANFSIGDIEDRMTVSVGPLFVYAKTEQEVSYLHELEPGTYRFYGPIFMLGNAGWTGTCYCMGSVKFEVKAGQITNLGDFFGSYGVDAPQVRSARTVDYTLPERLSAVAGAPADWRAAGKVDNIYHVTVGRIVPVAGVLAYQRDTVVDLKAPAGSEGGAP